MTDSRRVEISTRDSITLRGDFYQAAGDRVGVVVMLNGLSPPKRRRQRLRPPVSGGRNIRIQLRQSELRFE